MSARTFAASTTCFALVTAFALPASAQQELAQALSRLPPVFGEAQFHPRDGMEDIYAVARQFGVSASSIYNANVGDLQEGHELLLIPTEHIAPMHSTDGLVVNLSERGLYYYEHGKPVRRFPVAIGMKGWETPTGEFTIVNKAKNPTWFPPSWALAEKPVPPGPDNPLGDRWMGLSIKGYGIHATNAPWTVGLYVSHGCMRMYPEHARDLYQLVRVGTPVRIIYERLVLGYCLEKATVFMSYHPDPYQIALLSPDRVSRILEQYHIETISDMQAIEQALARPTSLPVPIAGSSITVHVNGAPLKLALGPTSRNGDWLVPAKPLATALRAKLEFAPQQDYFILSRDNERIFYSPGCTEAVVNSQLIPLAIAPQVAAGHPFIPLKATVNLLGGSVGWDEPQQTLHVWDPWSLGSFPRSDSN